MAEIIDVSSGEEEGNFEPLNVVYPDFASVSSNHCRGIFSDSSSSDNSFSSSGFLDFLSQNRKPKKSVSVFTLSKMENIRWVSEVVKVYKSSFKSVGSVASWRQNNRVTYDYDESDIIIEPCLEDDVVCVSRPVGREPEFFFMYEYLISTFNVFLPFTEFEESLMKHLNVAPTQLLPNSWGFIKGFQIVCSVLNLKPSVGVFFAFHVAKGCDKGGWVYLSSRPQRAILSAYASNYKSWRNNYFRVRPSEDFPELLIDEKGCYKFPIFWEEHPSPKASETKKLSENEERIVSVLEKLAPVCCRRLIEEEFDANKMEKLFLPLMPMKEKEILSYMKRIPAEKKMAAEQQSGLGKRKKAESKKDSPKEKRVHVEVNSPQVTLTVDAEGQGNPAKVNERVGSEKGPSWRAVVKNLENEFLEMENKFDELRLENGKVKKSKEVLTKDVISLRKELEKERKKIAEVKKSRNEQVDKLKNDLELEQAVSNSLKSRLTEKDQEIEELKMEVALQRSLGFENAVDQVKCLHPDLDISEISLWKVVRNGEIVEAEVSGDEEEEDVSVKDGQKGDGGLEGTATSGQV